MYFFSQNPVHLCVFLIYVPKSRASDSALLSSITSGESVLFVMFICDAQKAQEEEEEEGKH